MKVPHISQSLSRQFATMSFACALLIAALHSPSADNSALFWQWVNCAVKGGLCSIAIPWFSSLQAFSCPVILARMAGGNTRC